MRPRCESMGVRKAGWDRRGRRTWCQEEEVVRLWRGLTAVNMPLATEKGERVEVVYPGRRNGAHGPDFRDAVIRLDGRLLRGDIEVHVRASDWRTHGHHRDPAYDRVAVHVVFEDDGVPACRSGGDTVPLVTLEGCGLAAGSSSQVPCRGMVARGGAERLGECLDRAGEERFLARAAGFWRDIIRLGAGQSLYRGIMGALGYAENKHAFLALAERVPLQVLEGLADGAGEGECATRVQACLLGTAGLLRTLGWRRPSVGGANRISAAVLEEAWGLVRGGMPAGVMSPEEWHLCQVRPNNSPLRRLVAMGLLIHRYRGGGLVTGVLEGLREEPGHRRVRRHLEAAVMVTAHGGQAGSRLTSGGQGPALIGRERAAAIVVNVLLPFAFAWGGLCGQQETAARALNLYREYPSLAANAVERHMKLQFGATGKLISSARRQQGLLHLYRTRCTQGMCPDCELRGGSPPDQDSLRLGTTSKCRESACRSESRK